MCFYTSIYSQFLHFFHGCCCCCVRNSHYDPKYHHLLQVFLYEDEGTRTRNNTETCPHTFGLWRTSQIFLFFFFVNTLKSPNQLTDCGKFQDYKKHDSWWISGRSGSPERVKAALLQVLNVDWMVCSELLTVDMLDLQHKHTQTHTQCVSELSIRGCLF